jgi:hypothetical protein
MKPKVVGHATHVIIAGEVLFYDAKGPYKKSGVSVKGALEYDLENGLVKCHECGIFLKALGAHIRVHGMNAREYKIRHGLRPKSALLSESTRKAFIARALGDRERQTRRLAALDRWRRSSAHLPRKVSSHRTAETDNSRGLCDVQIVDRLRKAAEQLGRAPSCSEMPEFGLSPNTLKAHFGSLERLFKLARIQGRDQARWSDTALLAHIRNFIHTQSRAPHPSDCRRGLLPNETSYRTRFGSLARAIRLARNRKFRPGDLTTETRIRPIQLSKRKPRQRQRFWGVNVGRFAIAGVER